MIESGSSTRTNNWLALRCLGFCTCGSNLPGVNNYCFLFIFRKKRWWLTCATYIAKSRVPVFTVNPHRFVFLSLLLSRYRMPNTYIAPPTLSALLVFWRWLTWKMGLVVQAWNPNGLEGWSRRITTSSPAWVPEWVQSNLMRLFQDKHWKWLGLWLRGRLARDATCPAMSTVRGRMSEMLHAQQC